MAKSAETLAKYLESENDKDYLQDLLLSAQDLYESGKSRHVTIEKMVPEGFNVKICGLRALLPFSKMHMDHKDKFWPVVAPHLLNCRIKVKIDRIQETPLRVWVSATTKSKTQIELEPGKAYRGIVLLARQGNLTVDFGLHFDWRLGSIISHIDGSTLKDVSILAKYKQGDTIEMPYLWTQKRMYFGNQFALIPWYGGEVQGLWNTIQKATVHFDGNGKRQLHVNGKFISRRVDLREDSFEKKMASIDFYQSLKNGQEVDCKVMAINRKQKFVSVRLILPEEAVNIEPETTVASVSFVDKKVLKPLYLKDYLHRIVQIFKVKPASDFKDVSDLSMHFRVRLTKELLL